MLKPKECADCPLEFKGYSFSRPDGLGTSGVVGIGEALGHHEAIDGLPFRPRAEAGSALADACKRAGIPRNALYLWNVVGCQPPANKLEGMPWEQGSIAHCRQHFDRVVGGFQTPHQRTLLLMGNVPIKAVLGLTGRADDKQSVTHLRGYVFPSKYGPAVVALHPAGIRRLSAQHIELLVRDLQKAVAVANRTWTSYEGGSGYEQPTYILHPSLEEVESFCSKVYQLSSKKVLTYDIETPDIAQLEEDEKRSDGGMEIYQIQFSLGRGTGIAVPFKPPFIDLIVKILESPITKANHNAWNFDNKVLKSKGYAVNGRIHDTMWMFKHWHPGLPKGLQQAASLAWFPRAWKHLAKTSIEEYGCCDVDAVHWLLEWLVPLMKKLGIWDGYRRHVVDTYVCLQGASNRGISIDVSEKREVEEYFTVEQNLLDKAMQAAVPDELKDLQPSRKNKETGEAEYGYVRTPKEIVKYEQFYMELVAKWKSAGMEGNPISLEDFIDKKVPCKISKTAKGKKIEVDGKWTFKDGRWAKIRPFSPSSKQLVRYLRWKQKKLKGELENG